MHFQKRFIKGRSPGSATNGVRLILSICCLKLWFVPFLISTHGTDSEQLRLINPPRVSASRVQESASKTSQHTGAEDHVIVSDEAAWHAFGFDEVHIYLIAVPFFEIYHWTLGHIYLRVFGKTYPNFESQRGEENREQLRPVPSNTNIRNVLRLAWAPPKVSPAVESVVHTRGTWSS